MPQFVTDVRLFRPRDAGLYVGAVGVTGLVGSRHGQLSGDWPYARWPWGGWRRSALGSFFLSVRHASYTTNHGDADYFSWAFFNGMVYGQSLRFIHDVPNDVKATAQALYIHSFIYWEYFFASNCRQARDLHNHKRRCCSQ
jgi:hypothetical protein